MNNTVIKAFIYTADNEKVDKEILSKGDYFFIKDIKQAESAINKGLCLRVTPKFKFFLEKNG